MDWDEKLQIIIDYVENHLQRTQEPLDRDEIARIAGCSYSFFQKIFSYMNGISFAEYVRSRKLTLAGYDLKSTDSKVVDLSLQYGYDSPTSFTKAFQQFHGVPPKEARRAEVKLNVYPKLQIENRSRPSWKLEHKRAFRLLGKAVPISDRMEQRSAQIPAFWSDCQQDGTFSELISMDQGSPEGQFGVFECWDASKGEKSYSIRVESSKPLVPGYSEILIPEMTWAIFQCHGPVPGAIQAGWKYLMEEWVVKYPFQHADCPEIEWYSRGNSFAEDYLSQIWIPILEK